VHLLSSITHKDYSTVIAILSNGPMADLTFDKVAVTLLAEERRLAQAESTPGTSSKAEAAYVAANGSSAGRDRKVNNNRPRHPPCDECGFTNHPTAKCYRLIGYPEGHRLQSSAPPASNSKNATATLAFAWLGAVLDNDSAAAGPKMPAGPFSAAIAQTSSTPRVPQLNGSSAKACDWLLDSGASMHLCRTRQWFADFTPITGKSVILADGRVISALGRGRIDFDITIAGRQSHNTLNEVLYVPGIAANLLSVAKMTEAGLQLSFNGRRCVIRSKHGAIIARAEKQDNNLYRISTRARSTGGETSPPNTHMLLAAATTSVTASPEECSRQLARQPTEHFNSNSYHRGMDDIIDSRDVMFHIPGILAEPPHSNSELMPDEGGLDTSVTDSPVGHSEPLTSSAPCTLPPPLAGLGDGHGPEHGEQLKGKHDPKYEINYHSDASIEDTMSLSELYDGGGGRVVNAFIRQYQSAVGALTYTIMAVGVLIYAVMIARLSSTLIQSHSQGTIALSENLHQARRPHIDIRNDHFLPEQVVANHISLQHVSTDDKSADVMTKPLGRDQHNKLIHRLGVHSV
jgi:hypothetical protein